MTSRTSGNARDPHDEHDLEAVAAFAAGDATGTSRIAAERLVRDCTRCAALADDLRSLAAATRSLPRAAIAPRDFRIDAQQAARLRGGRWRRFLGTAGLAGWNPRPVAAAFTTLGIAGLLIAIVPFASLLGGSGGAGQRSTAAQPGGTALVATANSGPKVVVDASAGAGGGWLMALDSRRAVKGSHQSICIRSATSSVSRVSSVSRSGSPGARASAAVVSAGPTSTVDGPAAAASDPDSGVASSAGGPMSGEEALAAPSAAEFDRSVIGRPCTMGRSRGSNAVLSRASS